MATESVLTAIEQCKRCIDEKRSFVLQGGAGSGKTESLKELLIYINQTNPCQPRKTQHKGGIK